MRNPQHILITGASGGIGGELSGAYARPGVRLTLSGRNRDRLEKIASKAMTQGAMVGIGAIDIIDRGAMHNWIIETDTTFPIDLVIANAGISAGTGSGRDCFPRA